MKKRVLALALILALTLLSAPASALGRFADVTDEATARDVEVLRFMGVLEGDAAGTFRPGGSLTRAEFCKMTIVLQGRAAQVERHRSRTIFPDVRASHWASGYVNLAATPEGKDADALLHGFPDGTFRPDKAISYAEAVTVLLRALGYSETEAGAVWPDGYLALAKECGMSKGISASANASITRAQAAKLFVNTLTAKDGAGKTMLAKLGYSLTPEKEKEYVTLYSVDSANGELRTSDEKQPKFTMAKPMDSTIFNGVKGHVVVNADGEAVTFLPAASNTGGVLADAAVIVSDDGSTAGFDALTGGASNYKIFRNGVRASSAELRKDDVAIYNAAGNTVQVVDTRIAVYYENCKPSQAAPTSVEVLGGTKLEVMTTAQQSLSKFKPGDRIVLFMTADGRVAGAAANEGSAWNGGAQGNALAYVDDAGSVGLICGTTLLPLNVSGAGCEGSVVSVSQSGKGQISISRQTVTADAVDLGTMKMGARTVAQDAVVIEDGKVTTAAALGVSRVEKDSIAYCKTNSAGQVVLLVIGRAGNVFYGRAIVTPAEDDEPQRIAIEYASGKRTVSAIALDSIRYGDYVGGTISSDGRRFTGMTKLTCLTAVPASAWVGDTAVNYGGKTYTVSPKSVQCYNHSSGVWFTGNDDETALAQAKAYGGTMDLYVSDGAVRVIEVRA